MAAAIYPMGATAMRSETRRPVVTKIRVNIAALMQPFHACTADFIRDVCQARCCRSTTDPTGIAVVVTKDEAVRLRLRGAYIDDATGRIAPVNRRCPFQHGKTHLCILHGTDDKPHGCIISPFTINDNDTLIVRNRYRLLPCFQADGAVPVYEAHAQSLIMLFGETNAADIAYTASQPARINDSLNLYVDDWRVAALRLKNQQSKHLDQPIDEGVTI